jgi:hypothetical protein
MIKQALISVSDKTGVLEFARALARVRYAARCAPQDGWPSTDLPDLAGLARDLAEGCRSLADLRKARWYLEREIARRVNAQTDQANPPQQ